LAETFPRRPTFSIRAFEKTWRNPATSRSIAQPYHNSHDQLLREESDPSPPNRENWFGTDDRGARLSRGCSMVFALGRFALDCRPFHRCGVLYGAAGLLRRPGRHRHGARQGNLGREPGLYMLIIFSSLFSPSFGSSSCLIAFFGWLGIALRRAEFFKNRTLDTCALPALSARATGYHVAAYPG